MGTYLGGAEEESWLQCVNYPPGGSAGPTAPLFPRPCLGTPSSGNPTLGTPGLGNKQDWEDWLASEYSLTARLNPFKIDKMFTQLCTEIVFTHLCLCKCDVHLMLFVCPSFTTELSAFSFILLIRKYSLLESCWSMCMFTSTRVKRTQHPSA